MNKVLLLSRRFFKASVQGAFLNSDTIFLRLSGIDVMSLRLPILISHLKIVNLIIPSDGSGDYHRALLTDPESKVSS